MKKILTAIIGAIAILGAAIISTLRSKDSQPNVRNTSIVNHHDQNEGQIVTVKSVENTGQTVGINNGSMIQTFGPSEEQTKRIAADTVEAINHNMDEIERLEGAILSNRFDGGYILFTLTESNELMPLSTKTGSINVDLSKARVKVEANRIFFIFPPMILPEYKIRFGENQTSVERKIGSRAPVFGLPGGERMMVEVVKTKREGTVLALGIRK